ncbi:MAG: hypothetical protein Kow00104_10060 [Rhodothalassiaceae bacterium]
MTTRTLIGNGFMSGMVGAIAGTLLSFSISGSVDALYGLSGAMVFSAMGWISFRRAHLD